jgi:acetylornithine deacetylase/succinyl-diaminopimelate desuccinylase-like protein
VGAPFLVEERPELCPDFVIGEGAGERYDTPRGPVYLLDHGVKGTASATLIVQGRAADSSLPGNGASAAYELARLLTRLEEYEPEPRIHPALRELFDFLAPGAADDAERVRQARAANPALALIVDALVANVFSPNTITAKGPANVVPEQATVSIQCVTLPGVDKHAVERELREALGEGDYLLEVEEAEGGLISSVDSPLRDAISGFLRERDPEATLIPALGYGFSDCNAMRDAYGSTSYGFIPFPNADPMVNLTTKHGADERVLVDDLCFQAEAAVHVARAIGSIAGGAARHRSLASSLRVSPTVTP